MSTDYDKVRAAGAAAAASANDKLDMIWMNPYGRDWSAAREQAILDELHDPEAEQNFHNSHINRCMSAWTEGFLSAYGR